MIAAPKGGALDQNGPSAASGEVPAPVLPAILTLFFFFFQLMIFTMKTKIQNKTPDGEKTRECRSREMIFSKLNTIH